MRRLLESADKEQRVFVNYHEQWPTLLKAFRIGYVNVNTDKLTDKGREFLASKRK